MRHQPQTVNYPFFCYARYEVGVAYAAICYFQRL